MPRCLIIQTDTDTYYLEDNGTVYKQGKERHLAIAVPTFLVIHKSGRQTTMTFDKLARLSVKQSEPEFVNLGFRGTHWIGEPTSIQLTRGSENYTEKEE